MVLAAHGDGVEQRNADIVDQVQADERPRQLEASRQSEMGALVRGEAVDGAAVETHRALFVVQRAADAVDQRALAGAVRPDQANAFACGYCKRDVLQRDEAAEALAQVIDLEQVSCRAITGRAHRRDHGTAPVASVSTWRRPTKSSGLRCQ